MSEELINRVAVAMFDEHSRGLRASGFKSLVRENPDVHDMVPWRRYARAVVCELDLTDQDVKSDRVVMSFWRFDEALRQARKDAWDEGFKSGWERGHYETEADTNPHRGHK